MSSPHKQNTRYAFTLYVAGMNPRSTAAVENLTKMCEAHLKDHYELKVIDISKETEIGEEGDILPVPMLVKEVPLPVMKWIGDISNKENILISLEVE